MTTRYPTREYGVPFFAHAMQMVVNFDDTGVSSGIPFPNYIPQDAEILFCKVRITAAFNATTPVLVVGTNSSSFNNIVAAGDCDEATTGADIVFTGCELDTSSAPLLPYVKYSDAVAGTTGRAVITLVYVPKIDR